MVKAPPQLSGFTIIELMIVLAIAAILAAIAAPSFTATIQDNRLVTQVNELQASLGLARSEAIKQNDNVIICSINAGSCGGNWATNWIVFVDLDADGDFSAGDATLRVHGAITAGNTLTSTQNTVNYTGTGLSRANVTSTFRFCDARGATSARAVIINTTGRPGLAIDSPPADGTVNGGDGNNLVCP